MGKLNDNNIYIKLDNGRYIPYGCKYDERYLTDGIWYVKHREHSRSITNTSYLEGIYKVGEAEGPVDLPKICSMEDYKDYVLRSPAMQAIMNSGSFTWNDIVGKIIALVVDYNEKYKNKEEKKEDDNICGF